MKALIDFAARHCPAGDHPHDQLCHACMPIFREVQRFIDAAVLAERERCALIADGTVPSGFSGIIGVARDDRAILIAHLIRAGLRPEYAALARRPKKLYQRHSPMRRFGRRPAKVLRYRRKGIRS